MIKHTDISYTAGLLDGEGCITIAVEKTKRKSESYYLQISIVNTNKFICYWLKKNYGGSVAISRPKNKKHKTSYVWRLVAMAAARFLNTILPFLKIKFNEAKIAIKFQIEKDKHKQRFKNRKIGLEVMIRRNSYYTMLKNLKHTFNE